MDLDTELGALRRLAGALASGADADDLVQDTMLAALRRPPTQDRPVRPWLQAVLRNRRVSRLRALAREQARDAALPPAPAEPSLEHLQLLQELVAEVRALPEDDRQLLILRFWEGRSTPECAATLGHPPSTIRTQLARTLERLRVRLDRTRGGRAAWMPLVLPLLPPPPMVPTASAVSGAKTLALGGVIAAAVLWLGVAMPHGCSAHTDLVADVPDVTPSASAIAAPVVAAGHAEEPPRSAVRRTNAVGKSGGATPEPSPSDEDDDVLEYQTSQRGPTGGVHPLLALTMGLQGWWVRAIPCRVGDGPGSARLVLTVRFDPDGSTSFERVDASRIRGLSDGEVECVRQTLLAREGAIETVDNTVLGFDAGTTLECRRSMVIELDGAAANIVGSQPNKALYFGEERKPALEAIANCGDGPIEVELEFVPTTGALVRTRAQGDHARTARGRCTTAAIEAHVKPTDPFDPEVPGDTSLVCRFGAGDERGYLCRSKGISIEPRVVEG